MTSEEYQRALKFSKIPGSQVIVMTYHNGAKQVIRPSAAFSGSPMDMCNTIAEGAEHRIAIYGPRNKRRT